jgi:protein involved in polysaccharide export with SLBB domain
MLISKFKGKVVRNKLGKIIIWVSLLGVLASTAFAQKSFDEKTYKLKPEDVLRIQVFNQQQIGADIPVGIDGYIGAPFVGNLRVEGKTVSEVESLLYQLYVSKLKLRDPIISVSIISYRKLKANVTGMVQRSTEFFFRPGDTVMTLYSAGGGEVPDQSDMRKATLRRQGSKELIPIDLYAMVVLGDNSQNFELQDGDILDVPREQKNRILVLGAIKAPGLYPYRETMRLQDAIGIAGGEIRYLSMFSKTFILRELPGRPGEYLRINANFVKYIKGGDFAQNVKLMPGDLVYIPETNTPDATQLQSIVNTAFVLNTFSSFFGLKFLK